MKNKKLLNLSTISSDLLNFLIPVELDNTLFIVIHYKYSLCDLTHIEINRERKYIAFILNGKKNIFAIDFTKKPSKVYIVTAIEFENKTKTDFVKKCFENNEFRLDYYKKNSFKELVSEQKKSSISFSEYKELSVK